MMQILSLAGVFLVGVSAITTATVALAGTNLRNRDRTALWGSTAVLALVLVAVFVYTLTSITETR